MLWLSVSVAIKKTDNINSTLIIVFIDSKVFLTKIYQKNAKSAIKNFLYRKAIELV